MRTLAFSSALLVLLLVGCEAGVNRQKRDNHGGSGSATGTSNDEPRPILISNLGMYH